ncbi:MAG: hypothetical protein WAV92_09960 [Halopseudomonas yangmingensis]|uniref:Uncharacterized protein n=1 Tax=Halopseudomonas yangmingensis TaxID=1720063 RepID=A0A1I4U6S6_9GAMM|nr:hypothetical protein [Halopseudomonas yangmingensis]SFM84531.1 hypothetical protein SAMN05216217_11824 [Halopseudomonas yangmingensis]
MSDTEKSSCCGGCGGQGHQDSKAKQQDSQAAVGTFEPAKSGNNSNEKQSLLGKLGSLLGGR